MLSRPIQFRAGEVEQDLRKRTTLPPEGPAGQLPEASEAARLSETARRDLQRYYVLLSTALARLFLSVEEASLICDALNGTWHQAETMSLAWASVSDAIEMGHLDEKWQVDGAALVEKLRRLSTGETFALVDAVERFWTGPYHQEGPIADQLRTVGLVRN